MPNSPDPTRARRSWPLLVLTPLLALVALMSWAVASPTGSSPDDDYHLASIWCGLGDRPGICEEVPGHPDQRAVPAEVAQVLCKGTFPHFYPNCLSKGLQPAGSMVPTTRGNFSGVYPPVYYGFMSVFVTPDFTASVILMRVVNSVLFVGIGALLFWLLRPDRRRTLLWMWAIGTIPLGLFLIASTNPSAWAIIAGGSLWLALVGWFESSGWRATVLGVLSAVLAVMGAGARADSAMYTGVAVVVGLILAFRPGRTAWLKLILPAAILVVAVAFYFAAGQAGVSSGGLTGGHGSSGLSPFVLFATNLVALPYLWMGNLGTWGLGWLDTPLPSAVYITTIGVFCAVVFAGLRSNSARKGTALGLLFGLLVAIPSWVLLKSDATVGLEVQPRYILPLLLMFAGVAVFEAQRRLRFTPLQLGVAVFGLAVAETIALNVNMRRYISGLSIQDPNLNHHVQWWWNVPVSPMVVWIAGAIAFAGALVCALWLLPDLRPGRPVREPAAPLEARV